jgi:UDP-N-acetylglucosamine acyltransferase
MAKVHPTAIIEGNVVLGTDVEIGPYTLVKGNIKIGDGTKVGARVSLLHNVEIGKNCQIYDGAIIGGPPQHIRDSGEKGGVVIGDNTVIRECVTVNRGTDFDRKITEIGNNVFIMAYAHVAHDCVVGDNVIMANAATLGGHVVVERNVFLGGLSAVQQRCRVGEFAMIGGLSGVNKDVPPYTIAVGQHVELKGLNLVALKRGGVSKEDIRLLERVYRRVFTTNKKLTEEIEDILKTYGDNPYVAHFCNFILESLKRGRGIPFDKSLRKRKKKDEIEL